MSNSSTSHPPVSPDNALRAADALERDEFGRGGFAEAAARALQRISATQGFVLAIEGRWGSGKTSCMAMVEQLLRQQASPPFIVHFNPWLVGNRDQLLLQFLSTLAATIGQSNANDDLKRVSTELGNYSKALDLVRLIPGAEPWASIVKSVMQAMGNATEGIADQKAPNLEERRQAVADALTKLEQRIIVFIDDIDRLYPREAYEMVRILKAVGDLPNVGYVVGWDADYVAKALSAAGVPEAVYYLDKIVQVRLSIPPMRPSHKLAKLDRELQGLGAAANAAHFIDAQERLGTLYHTALRYLIESPRDITSIMNAVAVREPGVRGEIVLADVIGLETLRHCAPTVYADVQSHPEFYLEGRVGHEFAKKLDKEAANKRLDALLADTRQAAPIRDLLFHLFPVLDNATSGFALHKSNAAHGHLADEQRLHLALSLDLGAGVLGIVEARRFLFEPNERERIQARLTGENIIDFLSLVEDIADGVEPEELTSVEETAAAIARLVDLPAITEGRVQVHFGISNEAAALSTIMTLQRRLGRGAAASISRQVLIDPEALTLAAELLQMAFHPESRSRGEEIAVAVAGATDAQETFAGNVAAAARTGNLWSRASPSRILWNVARCASSQHGALAAALRDGDPTLDRFAHAFFYCSYSSSDGRVYGPPSDESLYGIFPRDALIAHAQARLDDPGVAGHVRAAWRALVENKRLIGDTGKEAQF